MLIVMRHGAPEEDIRRVAATIEEMGYQARPMPGKQRTTVGLVGNDGRVDGSRLAALPGVQEIIHVTKPYKQVSREWKPESTTIRLPGGLTIGGDEVVVMAGPCSVESEQQILAAARAVRESGATILRAGAYKPRSSPYSFQGMGRAGLKLLARAREETGLLIVTEAMDAEEMDFVAEVADIIQIGARNMQNYSLLKRGRANQETDAAEARPVRHHSGAAAFGRVHPGRGQSQCDSVRARSAGLRSGHEEPVRPQRHPGGTRTLPPPHHRRPKPRNRAPRYGHADGQGGGGGRCRWAPGGGASHPDRALSDGAQSLYPEQFDRMMKEVRLIAEAIGRRVAEPAELRT